MSSPLDREVLVQGRCRVRDAPEEESGCRFAQLGIEGRRDAEDLSGRSSPKRAWPQKAQVAAARQATSSGSAVERVLKRATIMDDVTGGRGLRFAEGGECESMPRTSSERRGLPLNGALWNRCQARIPDRSLRTEELEREPREDAAKAHSISSEAGKQTDKGASRDSQNARKREMELL
jgi:hypothetical protein